MTQPAGKSGGGHSPGLATHRGWHGTEKLGLTQHPGARRDKAGRALPAPAHGKAPLSAPLLIGSSFSLDPPGEEGALPGGRFAWHSRKLPSDTVGVSKSGMVGGGLWRLGKGLKHPSPGTSIPRASPGKAEARRAEKGEQPWELTSSREGPGGQVPCQLLCEGHRHTDIHTHTRTTFSARAANSSGSCLTTAARPSPRSRGGDHSFPSGAGVRGTVPYLPAWRRGYVSMALREREPGRQRERERGARTGLAGAGSAGGAKPAGLPPPLHWSRALPICRHHPGTLPACEPPPGTGRDPNPAPTACPGFAVPARVSLPVSVRPERWDGDPNVAHGCAVPSGARVSPRGSGTPPKVHSPPCALGGQPSPAVPAPIPASRRSGGRQVLPVTQFPLPLGWPFLWGLLLWWFI